MLSQEVSRHRGPPFAVVAIIIPTICKVRNYGDVPIRTLGEGTLGERRLGER